MAWFDLININNLNITLNAWAATLSLVGRPGGVLAFLGAVASLA
jgi:hypothetical protein